MAVLQGWRKAQLEERLAWGSAYQDKVLVFCREDGSPLHPQFLTKAFGRDAKAAGLPVIRLHDLRHSHASAPWRQGSIGDHLGEVGAQLGRDHARPLQSHSPGDGRRGGELDRLADLRRSMKERVFKREIRNGEKTERKRPPRAR